MTGDNGQELNELLFPSSSKDPAAGSEKGPAPNWISYRQQKRRTTLSLSMAGKCRMNLWLTAQGAEAEPYTPSAERVFEYGDIIEDLIFDERELVDHHNEAGKKKIGNWYGRSRQLTDPESGAILIPGKVEHRQLEVKCDGFRGHIDGIDLTGMIVTRGGLQSAGPILVDGKSANGRSFAGASKGPLTENVFSREYVITMQCYMAALREAGFDVNHAALVYADKEKGGLMFRHLSYDLALAGEGFARLRAGGMVAEPRPDFDWTRGMPIPLRCGYCEYKKSCSLTRHQPISEPVMVKGRPVWTVL